MTGAHFFLYSRPLGHKIGGEHGEAPRMCVSLCITSRAPTPQAFTKDYQIIIDLNCVVTLRKFISRFICGSTFDGLGQGLGNCAYRESKAAALKHLKLKKR